DLLSKALKKDKPAIRFLVNIVIASIPAALIGVALDKKFEDYATSKVVAIALILGGIVLWIVDRNAPPDKNAKNTEPGLEKINSKQAITVGFVQCLALIPGVSRSGASIVGGLMTGLSRVTATAFSFYLAIPILLGAGAYKLLTSGGQISSISGGG